MSFPEPSPEVVEAAAKAAYEEFSSLSTGQGGPAQHAYAPPTPWDSLERGAPFVKIRWKAAARAALVAALAKAREVSGEATQPVEPIDLAKNLKETAGRKP